MNNKENSFPPPHQSSSPQITAEQKARISQKFRAAKALLARKRPLQISDQLNLKNGDNTGTNRLPSFTPSKCVSSVRSCPERICRTTDEGFGRHDPQIVKASVQDKYVAASSITLSKQSEICESILKESSRDDVGYGLGTLETPSVHGHVSNSFITPVRQSECANLSDAFSLVADLDEDFDETILQEIDALCEEKSAKKLKQQDPSSENLCEANNDVGRMSLDSVSAENVSETEGTSELESGDRHELSEEGSDDIQGVKIGSFPQAYSDYLQSLNDQQKEAACSDISTPLMIVAGPGSGKTSTMVGRVLMLLNEGIDPTNILAMTFTTAAASEMRDRIGSVAGKEVAKQLMISTFHSFCLQLCRTHAEKLGRTSEFLIYGHGQQRRAIIEAVRLLENKKGIEENIDASKDDQYDDMSCAHHFKDKSKKWQKFVSQAKASGKTPSECRKMGDEAGALILENYDGILKSCNALDYHDLIICSVSLLTDFPEVCAESQDLWKAMVIDEFQDTSSMQYNFLRILASHNRITIVGDEDQSIFSFNGADVSGFESFRKDFPNHREVRLTKNYRSTRCIVEAASSLIHHNVKRGRVKQVLTDDYSGCKITVKECHNEDAQCAFVVDKILESASCSSDPKSSFGNIAILYRRQVSGKVFQTAFRNRKIPFNVHGVAFYRKKIIKAIMAMLKTTLPGCDDGAFRQTFKTILACEKEEKKKMVDYIDKISTIRKCSFISAARDIFSAKISGTFKRSQLSLGRKVLSTVDILSKLVHRKYLLEQRAVVDVDGGKLLNEDNDLRPVLQYLLDDVSNFLANHFSSMELEKQSVVEEESCTNMLKDTELEKTSIGEEKGCTNILKAFVDYISMRESENFRSRRQENKDSVTLTTIHQSKGLEWDTVFIVKANETEIPLLHEYNGVVSGNKTSLEEERRLLYVAMTRARKKLYILYILVDSNWQLLQPSRFLREIPNHLREVQTELTDIELQNMHADHSRVDVEVSDAVQRSEEPVNVQSGSPNVQVNGLVSSESLDLLEACSGDAFLKRFNVENRAMISHLFHQWARKKAFEDPKRLLNKIGFVIDERLRIHTKKHKDVLRSLKSSLKSEEAFQYAQNIVRWEKLPAEKRAHLTREKQEHFQKLRIENSMGSSEATSKQISYLQSLGCTVVPTSRLHASRLIEQYKAL
ncbi:hypothetical protein ACHQM5_001529 [Ranunculus cassubicifolius]